MTARGRPAGRATMIPPEFMAADKCLRGLDVRDDVYGKLECRIAVAVRDAYLAGVAAERERAARVADAEEADSRSLAESMLAARIAAAIRNG